MYSKSTKGTSSGSRNFDKFCPICDIKGHTEKNCWKVVGYTEWHPKYKKNEKGKESSEASGTRNTPGKNYNKWTKGKGVKRTSKFAGNAERNNEQVALTADQLEKLLKLIPQEDKENGTETDEEVDYFAMDS
ncbi:hypothetical protein RDABS01_036700 [Bienertia sinuspersici]